MSLNDTNLGVAKGVDIHPGVANPTSHSTNPNPLDSNFVKDPATDELGAGAGPNFDGHRQAARNLKQTAGVVEGRPGIIESTHIDPLDESSLDRDEWKPTTGPSTAAGGGILSNASTMAGGVTRMAYGTLAGDEQAKKAGKEAIYGKSA